MRTRQAAGDERVSAKPAHATAPPTAPARPASVHAAIDVGSNSVHLLVAEVAGARLTPLVDESTFLGLGDRVRREGTIGEELTAQLTAAVAAYAATARRLHARWIEVVGTEPLRRALDSARAVHAIEAAVGVPFHVLGHEEEGIATLLGATAGRPVTVDTLVVDIGGGSREFVVLAPGQHPRATGLRLGSATLSAELVAHDPPTPGEIGALLDAAREGLHGAPDAHPATVIAVGGTASNLARITGGESSGAVLSRADVRAALDVLAAAPADALVARHGLNPVRARILPAGAAIVLALLDRYRAGEVGVSDAGIREGIVLAISRAGRAWRDRLEALAAG